MFHRDMQHLFAAFSAFLLVSCDIFDWLFEAFVIF